MLLKAFPDINMVRQLSNDAAQGAAQWRNVVLNFECRETSRLNLESPYSLFLNLKGHSYCSLNKNQYRIDTDAFLLAQPGDIYGLTVDNMEKTELCNIHINKSFFDGAASSLTHTHEQLLQNPNQTNKHHFPLYSQLYRKDEQLNAILAKLTNAQTYDEGLFEPVLIELIEQLLLQHTAAAKSIDRLPFVKAAVRQELFSRLALARDYIYSNCHTPLNLDEVCRETGMSKFHFMRLFKVQYGITPHQYLTDVRMERAMRLLTQTNESLSSISSNLGYEYPNSFIKAFRKAHHTSPMQYRKHEISNIG